MKGRIDEERLDCSIEICPKVRMGKSIYKHCASTSSNKRSEMPYPWINARYSKTILQNKTVDGHQCIFRISIWPTYRGCPRDLSSLQGSTYQGKLVEKVATKVGSCSRIVHWSGFHVQLEWYFGWRPSLRLHDKYVWLWRPFTQTRPQYSFRSLLCRIEIVRTNGMV